MINIKPYKCERNDCNATHKVLNPRNHGWDKTCIACGKEFDFVHERFMHENFACQKFKNPLSERIPLLKNPEKGNPVSDNR